MPYIPEEDRYKVFVFGPKTAGELNFLFTEICKDYLEEVGTSYTTFNTLIGALEGCKLELYRRQCVPYEDGCIERNGDVW